VRYLESEHGLRFPVGQKEAVNFLRKAVESGCSTFLFCGDEHIGKGTLALYLACMLNCQEEKTPCGKCSVCRRILKGSFADVRILRALSTEENTKTGVSTEQVKEILESASLAPYEGKAKVYIIEEAENLSLAAANRLLKTLEEHESHVYFVLLAENASSVLATVASRLIKVELKKAAPADIAAYLSSIGADLVLADELSQMANGNTGWAVLALENPEMVAARREQTLQALKLAGLTLAERLSLAGEISKGFSKDRQKLYSRLEVWQSVFRDILMCSLNQEQLVSNKGFLTLIKETSALLHSAKISAFLQKIIETKQLLKQNVTPQLALEVMMISF
jgi:DNA polymerase-3 subunit delta'